MTESNEDRDKPWHIIRCVELGATAPEVWEVIGGFYTIHEWHPDISILVIPAEQTKTREMRRHLTFPGQPITTEELVSLNNDDFHYRYKWHQGEWGEQVKNYKASLRILAGDLDRTCIVQWESTFNYPTDAISEFYWNGFRELQKRFPLDNKE